MDNIQLGTKLKMRRKKCELSIQEVADFLGLNKSTVSRWETGKTSKIDKRTLRALATLFKVPLEFLENNEDESVFDASEITEYVPKRKIPVLGKIAAGLPLYAEENLEGFIYTEYDDSDNYFALKVKGDSMNAARINDGDTLVIRQQDYAENGEIAVVMVNGDEATVKKFHKDGEIVMLIPVSTNPKHQIQVYNTNETGVRVLGKVVENKIKF